MSELFYKAAGAILAPFRYAEREVKNEVRHFKEEAKEDLQAFVANLVRIGVIVVASLLFLLFISLTAAAAINESMNSNFLGYVMVAGFYLLVSIGLYIWKTSTDKKKEETPLPGKSDNP